MGIKQSPYLPRQMNGPVVNSLAAEMEKELSAASYIADYLHGLSIDTARETELEQIGLLIGYPRPSVPVGFDQEDIFVFSSMPSDGVSVTRDPHIGFGSCLGTSGGLLLSVDSNYNGKGFKLELGIYRKILAAMAYMKRYGVTLETVDKLASAFGNDYTISWDEAHDILLSYNQYIGYKYQWVLSGVFYRYCTSPMVKVRSLSAA